MFEVGKVYLTHDWFTGGTLKYQYEGNNVFTVENFEIDGVHINKETHDIKTDHRGEYICLGSYHEHEHRVYANGE